MRFLTGVYEEKENIWHCWFPKPVRLENEETVAAFFEEGFQMLRPLPRKPHLLINYSGLHIRPDMAPIYAKRVKELATRVIDIYRYGIAPDFTGVTVRLGNLEASNASNVYASEQAARLAIRAAQAASAARRPPRIAPKIR